MDAKSEHKVAQHAVAREVASDFPQDVQTRESLYQQHFVSQVAQSNPSTVFFQQVDGFGVRVFAQASSFHLR